MGCTNRHNSIDVKQDNHKTLVRKEIGSPQKGTAHMFNIDLKMHYGFASEEMHC